jgi:hypothetical protein
MGRIILFVCILFSITAKADHGSNASRIDSVTYIQYLNAHWKALIDTADIAIQNGDDFYWLYVRAAWASQQLNKPYAERYYLQRGDQKYPGDQLLQTRLYLNSFATNQYTSSLNLNRTIMKDSSLAMYYKRLPYTHLVNLEGGIKFPTDKSLYDPMYYGQAGVGFRVRNIAFYTAFMYLEQKMYYCLMKQHQIYASAAFSLKNKWQFAPMVNILTYHLSNTPGYFDSTKLSATAYAAGFQVSRLYKNFNLGAGFYYSHLGGKEQVQIQPSVVWYPFANNKLYAQATFNYLAEQNIFTVSGTVGYMPLKKLSFTAGYLSAGTRYFTEQNGFVVNNSYDITKYRYLASCTWQIKPLLSVYGLYQYETKTENYYNTPYAYNTGIIGVKKNF